MKFIAYNRQSKDIKVFTCQIRTSAELKGWILSVFRDTDFTVVIIRIKQKLFVLEKSIHCVKEGKTVYTRTQVNYHPLESRLESRADIVLENITVA